MGKCDLVALIRATSLNFDRPYARSLQWTFQTCFREDEATVTVSQPVKARMLQYILKAGSLNRPLICVLNINSHRAPLIGKALLAFGVAFLSLRIDLLAASVSTEPELTAITARSGGLLLIGRPGSDLGCRAELFTSGHSQVSAAMQVARECRLLRPITYLAL